MNPRRIRHLYQHAGPQPDWGKKYPRGWITPEGRFLTTKEHWRSITYQFRRPEERLETELTSAEVAEGERIAQIAYSLGWISVGHAGELNAVGHERILRSILHPATNTLRKLLADVPEFSIHVELEIGRFDPSKGIHEDFSVKRYDLDRFIKRGKLFEYHEGLHSPHQA